MSLKGTIPAITADETVIFTNLEDLLEYDLLADNTTLAPSEIEESFPQFQSKHWSCSLKCMLSNSGSQLSINKSKLGRTITFPEWKQTRNIS